MAWQAGRCWDPSARRGGGRPKFAQHVAVPEMKEEIQTNRACMPSPSSRKAGPLLDLRVACEGLYVI